MDPERLKVPESAVDSFLEFARMRHEQEISRPSSLNTKLSICVAVVAIILNTYAGIYDSLPMGHTWIHWCLYGLLLAAFFCFIRVLWFLLMFLWGEKYAYPSVEHDLMGDVLTIEDYFQRHHSKYFSGLGSKDNLISRTFKLHIADTLLECVRNDHVSNNRKTRLLISASRNLIILSAITFVVVLLFAILRNIGE